MPWPALMYKKHPYDETTRPAEEFYDLSGGPVRVLTSGEFQTRWGGHTWQQVWTTSMLLDVAYVSFGAPQEAMRCI